MGISILLLKCNKIRTEIRSCRNIWCIWDFITNLRLGGKYSIKCFKWNMYLREECMTSSLGQVTDTAMWNAVYEHCKKKLHTGWMKPNTRYIDTFHEYELHLWGKNRSKFDLLYIWMWMSCDMEILFVLIKSFFFVFQYRNLMIKLYPSSHIILI